MSYKQSRRKSLAYYQRKVKRKSKDEKHQTDPSNSKSLLEG
jgi:hypothetical protein